MISWNEWCRDSANCGVRIKIMRTNGNCKKTTMSPPFQKLLTVRATLAVSPLTLFAPI